MSTGGLHEYVRDKSDMNACSAKGVCTRAETRTKLRQRPFVRGDEVSVFLSPDCDAGAGEPCTAHAKIKGKDLLALEPQPVRACGGEGQPECPRSVLTKVESGVHDNEYALASESDEVDSYAFTDSDRTHVFENRVFVTAKNDDTATDRCGKALCALHGPTNCPSHCRLAEEGRCVASDATASTVRAVPTA